MTKQRLHLVIAIILSSSIYAFSQGIVRGIISDENGETLIGVSVYLKEQASTGVSTDLDGYYSLELSSGVQHIVVISYLSYETIEDTIVVEDGEVLVKDFSMTSSAFTLNEVEVVAKQERSRQYYMESIKKTSASTLDYMSNDLMKRIGDNNVAAAISRVTGVATNGSFITVRGLGDRYVQTSINGALIPTLDPFTNNIKLDLFPSSFVDNIVITKTASPELQGDWSAAYISLETRDNPDKLTIAIETKVGFNAQTSFKKILTNETSATDWLGFDNGFREINHKNFTPVVSSPTAFQEFCALGLESYYRSIGITESWTPGSQVGQTYFKLGLVELGLLGKAFINDEQSVNRATEQYYSGDYQSTAFKVMNQKAEESLDDFANNWNTFEKKAPLNFSQSFSIGNQSKLFGKQLSFLAGFRYGNSIQYDPNAVFTRTIVSLLDSLGNPLFTQRYHHKYAKYTSGWTGLATTNFKLNANNSFTLLFMPNFIGANNIREGVDQERSTTFRYAFLQGQFYEERTQLVYQYRSAHYLPSIKARLHLSASYADGQSSAPDFKSLQYFSEDSIHYRLDKTVSNVRRNFRYLDENIFDAKASLELTLVEKSGYLSKLKLGGSYLDKQREFVQYDYLLQLANGVTSNFENGDLNELFKDEKFTIQTDSISGQARIDLFYRQFNDPANHVIGYSKAYSGFAMIDQSITKKIRVSGGLRAEYTAILTDVKLFSNLGYASDDLRRRTPEQSFILTPSKINQWNFLPSVNFVYKLRINEIFPANLRFNYSHTIARPSLREYTETIVRDFELNADVFGNADLKFIGVDNFDMRYENYFQSGNYISVSLFYKNFKNHIELTSSNIGFTWSNADKSNAYGIEAEGRIGLGRDFEFRTNVSTVRSNTQVEDRRLVIENGIKSWIVIGSIERTMFGQAPYVVNAILTYSRSEGLSASLSYNVQGPKLVLTSIDTSPDVYEMPRHLLNAKVSHPINKHFDVSLAVKDILNTPVRRAYKYDEGFLLDFDSYRYGSEISLAVSYKL